VTVPAIETEGLTRAFGEHEAVSGIDLVVQRSEIYGFLGPNGAGKSTTVRMLCTLLAPTSGRATVAGYDVVHASESVRLRIGVALQSAALDPKQTGRELLRLQARLYGLRRREAERRVGELIEMVDVGPAIDDRIATYSGGMKRRVDLAAALVHDPEILFLDEPTTGLDPTSRTRVWEEVRRLNREIGTTIFLTTQYLEEADVLAGRVAVMVDGRIAAEGTPEQLKRRIGTDLIVVHGTGDLRRARQALAAVPGVAAIDVHGDEIVLSVAAGSVAVSHVAVALHEVDVQVKELTVRSPTLDDVFLELTGGRFNPDGADDGQAGIR
jgi:ABC-2 type transport system ATP-binding protein